MSEGVPDTSHLPFKMGQEVICREGRVRREWGRDEEVVKSLWGLDTYALILDWKN